MMIVWLYFWLLFRFSAASIFVVAKETRRVRSFISKVQVRNKYLHNRYVNSRQYQKNFHLGQRKISPIRFLIMVFVRETLGRYFHESASNGCIEFFQFRQIDRRNKSCRCMMNFYGKKKSWVWLMTLPKKHPRKFFYVKVLSREVSFGQNYGNHFWSFVFMEYFMLKHGFQIFLSFEDAIQKCLRVSQPKK